MTYMTDLVFSDIFWVTCQVGSEMIIDDLSRPSLEAKFQGAYGKASWFTSEEDLGSGLFRHTIV